MRVLRTMCLLALLGQSTPGGTAQTRQGGYSAFAVKEALEEARYSAAYRAWIEESGGVTAALRDCAAAEYQRLDLALNQAYRSTMQRLPAVARARLRTEQRAWLKAKDPYCRREVEAGGGTMDLLALDDCALREMVRRTIWIEGYR